MSFEYYNEDAYLSFQDGVNNQDDEVLFSDLQNDSTNRNVNGVQNDAFEPSEIDVSRNGTVKYQPTTLPPSYNVSLGS
jgi:hypothetical protein